MHTFGVWAPQARTVAVRLASGDHALERDTTGWWRADVQDAQAGQEYWFVVDGADPLPDPRSGFQPHGIHGPSQIVDHSRFHWHDKNFQATPFASAILYELHVGTFTPAGTFLSAIDRLDYLAELGITHVELMPIAEFSGVAGWGYDGVDLYAPHHAYGTPDELKRLIDACHARGLAVLVDVVYNHLGPLGNYLSRFGPYFTEAYHTPWGAAVNLDHAESAEVRRFFIDNALMWLRDYHFDGLRLDAVHAFFDHSAIHFLEEIAARVADLSAHLRRYFVVVAESDLNDPRIVTPSEAGGFGLDAQWSDDFHHALHTVLTSETKGYYEDFGSLAQLAALLRKPFLYEGAYSPHRKRLHGKPVCGLSGNRFLAYAQNHDQIGNRARGERMAHLVSAGRSKIAAAFVMTSAYLPMLFQGEEFAASSPFQYFTRHEELELAHNVSEGRKKEFAGFGWKPDDVPDPQSEQTFVDSKLKWEESVREPHAAMLAWHKALISLRRQYSELSNGRLADVKVHFDEADRWLVVERERVVIVCNLGKLQTVPICTVNCRVELCSETNYQLQRTGIELPPDSIAILIRAPNGARFPQVPGESRH